MLSLIQRGGFLVVPVVVCDEAVALLLCSPLLLSSVRVAVAFLLRVHQRVPVDVECSCKSRQV